MLPNPRFSLICQEVLHCHLRRIRCNEKCLTSRECYWEIIWYAIVYHSTDWGDYWIMIKPFTVNRYDRSDEFMKTLICLTLLQVEALLTAYLWKTAAWITPLLVLLLEGQRRRWGKLLNYITKGDHWNIFNHLTMWCQISIIFNTMQNAASWSIYHLESIFCWIEAAFDL